jgi:tetratricopeptide (TPR) repeat protein
MEEAFSALQAAPTYLPLHILIGELLLQEGNLQDAAAKFTVVADAYSSRGDSVQAIAMLKRIVQVTPMDMGARAALVDRMVSRGMVDEAVGEYVEMGDIYYRMAELDAARKVYTTALRLVQQGDAKSAWSTNLLRRMADIDMQKLDWRQALRLFEQMRSLDPGDFQVRRNMIDLNIRLNQVPLAAVELEGFLSHLQGLNRRAEAIPFLESLAAEYPRLDFLQHSLAEEYFRAGQPAKAVTQLDAFGKSLLDSGDRAGAARVVESILAFEPPNREAYAALLARLRPAA